MLAVTAQVAGFVTVSAEPEILQPSVVVANVTAPAPEPPAEVKVTVAPATAFLVVLLTLSAA